MDPRTTIRSLLPATRWQDALPTGSGSVGASVLGNIVTETVLLNHERLYLPADRPDLPDISRELPELRRMLDQGRWSQAQSFFENRLRAAGLEPGKPSPYQPAFDLRMTTDTRGAFTDYARMLDMTTGEVHVAWTDEPGARLRKRLFVSRADDAVCARIEADRPGLINVQIALAPHRLRWLADGAEGIHVAPDNPPPIAWNMWAEADCVFLVGTYETGRQYGGVFRVIPSGGRLETEAYCVHVSEADSVELVGSLFVMEDAQAACDRIADELRSAGSSYQQRLAEHERLHRPLFESLRLDLQAENRDQANEQLLLDAYNGQACDALIERMFLFGRHLAICSNRPGSLPANLQGIWNGDYAPAWAADFHNNINIQMNYWAVLAGNCPELNIPLIDWSHDSLDDWRTNARNLYGCRGIQVAHAQTTHGLNAYRGPWPAWTAGAAWLAQHWYDHYLFTGDRELLARRILPLMVEAAAFYEDFLFAGDDGRCVFSPSLSPENTPSGPEGACQVTVSATMDRAVAAELLSNLIDACEQLELEHEKLPNWRAMLDKLPDYRVNADGALAEWIDPRFADNDNHRHASHLYPLFPGREINASTGGDLYQAARKAAHRRMELGLQAQSGWSLMFLGGLFARLREGDDAARCLDLLLRSCTGPNLYTYHNDWRAQGLTLCWMAGWTSHSPGVPFQIDANFGFTAVVLEMLVFSTRDRVVLLPALPERWARGRIAGAACRGGVNIRDLSWDIPGRTIQAELANPTDRDVSTHLELGLAGWRSDTDPHLHLPPGQSVTVRYTPGD